MTSERGRCEGTVDARHAPIRFDTWDDKCPLCKVVAWAREQHRRFAVFDEKVDDILEEIRE